MKITTIKNILLIRSCFYILIFWVFHFCSSPMSYLSYLPETMFSRILLSSFIMKTFLFLFLSISSIITLWSISSIRFYLSWWSSLRIICKLRQFYLVDAFVQKLLEREVVLIWTCRVKVLKLVLGQNSCDLSLVPVQTFPNLTDL